MSRDFSSRDARQLIRDYELCIARQDRALADHKGITNNISRSFDYLYGQNVFKNAISAELINGSTGKEAENPAFRRLLSFLYLCKKQQPEIARLDSLNKSYRSYIDSLVQKVRPAASGIKWAFASSAKKAEAAAAYVALSEILNNFYLSEAENILAALESYRNLPQRAVEEDFAADRFSGWMTLQSVVKDAGKRGGRIPEIDNLCARSLEILDIPKTAAGILDKYREGVKDAANRMLAGTLMEILKGVPVDELNRDRQGIRVKTLKDSGFETLADIYAATVHSLSSINGISGDMAGCCKQIAKEYAGKTISTIKVKLSADEQTPETSALLNALREYREKKPIHDIIEKTDGSYHSRIASDVNNLAGCGNGSEWLFYSDRKKDSLKKALSNVQGFLASQYPEQMSTLLSRMQMQPGTVQSSLLWDDFINDSIPYINALEEVCPGLLGNDDSVYGLPEDLAREIQAVSYFPEGLLCELRRYQEWGVKYILHQENVLLGDEMGLGKTVQAIAAMVSLRNTGATHFLVVCPASVIENWCREVRKHSRLEAVRIHGDGREDAIESWKKYGGAAITTYETTGHIQLDDGWKYDLLVVDEAHYVKNPQAKRTQNVITLGSHASRKLFMTGTALENRVDEMIALIRILNPQISQNIERMAFMSQAPQFREAVAPVYYRRKREDVLTELPEMIENQEWCTLSAEEELAYETAVLGNQYAESRRVSWNIPDVRKSVKAARMIELIEEAEGEGRKILVFSFFLDTIRKVCELLGTRCYGPINGSVPPARRQQIIDEFDKAPAGAVLAAQIQAGGTGLNIQAASVVIICEPQLKPSIENQAVSRAYRMGQARNVLVYRLLCKDTVDERITEILEEKQLVFDTFADSSVAAEESFELDDKTFGDIIREEIDRINAKRADMQQMLTDDLHIEIPENFYEEPDNE